MYKSIICFLFSLLFLNSCRQGENYRRLVDIDSLLKKEKLSVAHDALQRMSQNDFTDEELAYYQLLTVQCQYLRRIPFTTDSLINQSLNYYNRHSQKEKRARAYYCKSLVMLSLDSLEASIYNIKEAETLAEKMKDLDLLRESNIILSYLNSRTGNSALAISYGKKALDLAYKTGNKKRIGYCLDNLSTTFDAIGQTDSSNYYDRQMITYIPYQAKEDQPFFHNNAALYYKGIGHLDSAIRHLNSSLELAPMPHTYFVLAEVYALEGKQIEADSCWQEALKETDKDLYVQILKKYITWLHQQGRHHDATQMTQKLFTLRESLQGQQKAERLYRIQSEYEHVQVEEHGKKIFIYGTALIFILAASVVFIWCYYRKRRSIARNLLSENQAQIEKYEGMLSELEKSGRKHQQNYEALIRKIEKLQKENKKILHRGKNCYDAVVAGNNILKWNKEDSENCIAFYEIVNPKFKEEVLSKYKALTISQELFLMLVDMGKSEEQIKQIMNLSEGALRTMRYRIRRKGGEDE